MRASGYPCFTRFLFPAEAAQPTEAPLLCYLARRTGLIPLPSDPGSDEWQRALAKARRALNNGNLIGVTVVGPSRPECGAAERQRTLPFERRAMTRGAMLVIKIMPFVSLQGAAANFLTNNVYDPNGMPEYKVCAVRIAPA